MKAAKRSFGKKVKAIKGNELSELEKDYTKADSDVVRKRITHARKLWSLPAKKKPAKNSKKYSAEWLNSKGFSIVKVKCAGCGKAYEEVAENVRKKEALKNDVFFCGNCDS